MLRYIASRVVLMIPILLGVSIVAFGLIRLVPGDPVTAMLGPGARYDAQQLANIRSSYGLNQPVPVQYVKWMGKVLQGDLGQSLRTKRPLSTELGLRLPVTLELTLWAGLIGTAPALTLGVLAARVALVLELHLLRQECSIFPDRSGHRRWSGTSS